MLNDVADILDNVNNNGDPTEQKPTPIEDVPKGEIFEDTTKIEDSSEKPDDDIFYIPGGFEIDEDSPTEIDEGIVITNEDDTKQFVWIPVNNIDDMYIVESGVPLTSIGGTVNVTTNVYSNITDGGDIRPGSYDYREPDILESGDGKYGLELIKDVYGFGGTNEEVLTSFGKMLVKEYEETYKSIKKYGGFYVGRYELTGDINSPTVQKGQEVIINHNWYELRKACSNVIKTNYAQTTMIYGNQWDQVMRWLIDTNDKTEEEIYMNSTSWGNYSDSIGEAKTDSGIPQTSGKNEAWKGNNIYDLAGNFWELTQEALDYSIRLKRSGVYNKSGESYTTVELRLNASPYENEENAGTRATLYIK